MYCVTLDVNPKKKKRKEKTLLFIIFEKYTLVGLHNNQLSLCRTLPAGYLEVGESAAEGATRETLEEACAEVEILSPFAQLDIPRIGQVRKMHSYR